jgi:hypothetical protein
MTVLIAWASLSVGIVIGAAWRSLCEKQSSRDTSLWDGNMMLHRLDLQPQLQRRRTDQRRPA